MKGLSNNVPSQSSFIEGCKKNSQIIQLLVPGILNLCFSVQFVDNFFGSRLSGEDQYWWMQFVAAIEFIKTMDYQSLN